MHDIKGDGDDEGGAEGGDMRIESFAGKSKSKI